MLGVLVLQPDRHYSRLLFLDFWTSVWTPSDGTLAILVRLAWRKA
jgi:hypothetical protein